MDLRLFLRVLWRFRLLVATGLLLTLAAAFLSFVRVSVADGAPRAYYREDQTWQSQSLLLITQRGFPWGRSVIEPEEKREILGARKGAQRKQTPRFADSSRAGYLAILYAQLATSDPVRALVQEGGPLGGTIDAAPVLASETLAEELRPFLRYEAPLPLVRVTAEAASPGRAQALARREVDAFLAYLARQQEASAIPRNERVVVTVLEEPRAARVVEGRSKIYPALVLVAGIGLTVGLAFVLENLRPRTRPRPASGAPVTDPRRPVW